MKKEFEHIDWDFFLKHFQGACNESDLEMFESWLAEDKKHQLLYDSFIKTQNNKKLLYEAQQADLEKALYKVKHFQYQTNYNKTNFILRIAAIFILAVGISFIATQLIQKTQYTKIVTSNGEWLVQTLPDSSVVSINENTVFLFPKRMYKSRKVKLNGEAFFEVKRDTTNPFIVNMDQTYVKVLGTKFNILNRDKKTEISVSVIEGKVEFGSNSRKLNPQIIKKGEKVGFNKKSDQYILYPAEHTVKQDIAWKTKQLEFKNALLSSVVEKLEEVYYINIHLDEKLKSRKLNAIYNNQPLESIFEILESTLDVEINKTGENNYEIVNK